MMTPASADEPRDDGRSGSAHDGLEAAPEGGSSMQRRYDRLFNTGGHRAVGAYLRERIYATFTGLAIVLVVAGSDHEDADHALLALLFGVLGITIAGLVSDMVSHLAVEGEFPHGADWVVLIRVAGGGLSTVVVPGGLMLLGWLEIIDLSTAISAAAIVYIATLGLIGWLAVRRSHARWWERAVALGILIGLGFLVIALQTLAKLV
ncbi:hypothetical protein IT882_15100 [Microbacterium schleiferi]|uniref:VIT family protein n=1 Tax=Microbacterium schleiferi TaxID=69362 RepID=A0A7S8MWE1_9MICO|nr:hypothetical protein [Microbacterium schleiferi]QPE04444.1 hypothetical protein IT882_15100 [Microbacterium schleiferi]